MTAIRQADPLNSATDPDVNWLPLLTTPPYPSYAGNMATIGASAARALQLAFGTNDIAVRATWKQSAGGEVTHEFAGFGQAAQEQAESRIYGGIHYRFDNEAGQQIGRSAAEFVFANFMTPRGGGIGGTTDNRAWSGLDVRGLVWAWSWPAGKAKGKAASTRRQGQDPDHFAGTDNPAVGRSRDMTTTERVENQKPSSRI